MPYNNLTLQADLERMAAPRAHDPILTDVVLLQRAAAVAPPRCQKQGCEFDNFMHQPQVGAVLFHALVQKVMMRAVLAAYG